MLSPGSMSPPDIEPVSWKTIVVGTDFSLAADHAVITAARLAVAHRSTLVLVHVCELPPGLAPNTMIRPSDAATATTIDAHLRDAAIQQLEGSAARLVGRAVPVSLQVAFGSPAERLVSIAGERTADVVVVGTQGRTGLARALLGSVAERVVRGSPMPVLTVRHGARETLTLPAEH